MRNYWLKIAATAFGIFVVGMILVTTVRGVKNKVTSAIHSSEPIPIPLIGMVPFRLDSEKLGSLSRLEFLRSDPQHVSGVRVVVKLDSAGMARLRNCALALDDLENIGEHTTFRCQAPGEVRAGLEQFGTVVVRGLGDSFPLLLPSKAIADLRETTFRVDHNGINITSASDERRALVRERVDSIREAADRQVDARSDSVDALRELADDLEDSASAGGAAERLGYQRRADSARAAMRVMVERLKADEARLAAIDEVRALSEVEIDSIATQGRMIADSVHQVVARELQRVAREMETMRVNNRRRPGTGAGVRVGDPAPVEAPAMPPPPTPPAPASRP